MQELYDKLLEFTKEGVHSYTLDEGRILAANRGLVQILGLDCPPESLIGKRLNEVLTYVEPAGTIRSLLKKTGEIHDHEYHFKTLKGEDRWVLQDSFLTTDSATGQRIVQAIVRDITPLKRAERDLATENERLESLIHLYQIADLPAETLTNFALEEGVKLTASHFGCIGYLNDDETMISLRHWSSRGRAECRITDNPSSTPIREGGIWREVIRSRRFVIRNDLTAASTALPVLPEGHVTLTCCMTVPIFDGEHIVALVTVGNKETPYNDFNARQLMLLMAGLWQLLRRKRVEQELLQHRTHLEQIVAQRTTELAHTNAALQTQITELARVEKALRESEEKFRLAVTSAPIAIFRHDRKLRYTWIHYPKAPFPISDFIGKTDAELLPPDEGASLTELKHRVLQTGAGARGTLPMTYRNATYFYDITVEPLRDPSGKISGLTCIALDITERHHAEEEAHREAQLLQLTHDAILVCDMEGRIQFWNRGAERLYGWHQQDVLGRKSNEVLGTHFPVPEDQVIAELLENGRWEGELEQLSCNGRHLVVASRWALVRDAQGQPTGILKTNYDITERKRVEENLRLSNVELEQFAYVASHDLQEPLRVISGFLQLLQHRYAGKLGSDADEYIRYAVDGAGRMRNLIRDLLEYSRVGRRGRPFAPTDCGAIMQTVIGNLQPAIVEKQGRVLCEPLPTVMGDSTELTQLFQNIIANAIKFRGPQPPEVRVSAQQREHEWVFRVHDNGIGIDPKDFQRIFIIFQRLHGPEEYPGTGIGLALCKKIVERHGGRIWVESTPGSGTTFHFTLPAESSYPV
jgi:PAS domain S-box-containing protein